MSTNFDRPDSTSLHVMLSELQCPYQVDDQAMCSYNQGEAFCPFGHRSHHTNTLPAIPSYICVDHLLGKCIHDGTTRIPIEDGWLTRCSVGYHPTWTQLSDLEQLDQLVQVADNELTCAICLEQMHSPYGLLEHCGHLSCGECIVRWQETDRQKRCPVCRVHSQRVLPLTSTDPFLNEQAKLELFRLQARCINLFHGDNQVLDWNWVQDRVDQEQQLAQERERREQQLDRREQDLDRREQDLDRRELARLHQELARLEQERARRAQEQARMEQERGEAFLQPHVILPVLLWVLAYRSVVLVLRD